MIPGGKQPLRYEGELSVVYGAPLYEKVDIQAMIDEAYARGDREITIPRGAYRIMPNKENKAHILLKDMKDFTVNAYGVYFLYQNIHYSGFCIRRCDHVTVRGLTGEYEDTIITQCKIVGIDPDRMYLDLFVDEGYACYDEEDIAKKEGLDGLFYDGETGLLKYGPVNCFAFNTSQLELLGERRIRLHMPLPNTLPEVKLGDYFCPMATGLRPFATNTAISASGPICLEDYTCWSSTVSCISECYSDGGSTYRNIRIEPGPKPYGATHKRMISMSGDGFHMTSLRHGPLIENSLFDSVNDDGINIHGIYAALEADLGNGKWIIANHCVGGYRAGDEIRVYDEELRLLDRVKVVSGREITGEYRPENPLYVKLAVATFTVKYYYEVQLDRPLVMPRGTWLVNADCIGAGMTVRNSIFRNISPRGILLKTSNALIENCLFDTCARAGVKILPEHQWLECDYSTNVTVRDCIFRNCGFQQSMRGGAAITVDGHEAIEHDNIVIENNIFEDNHHRDLQMNCLKSATIRNNRFGKQHPHAYSEGFDFSPCFYVNKAKDVLLEGNTYPEDRMFGVRGPEAERVCSDILLTEASFAADAIPGDQGRGGWHWQYAPIGTNEYYDYPNWIGGHAANNGWWNGDFGDYTDGCILRQWWDTYMCPGTRSDAVKAYTCPRDGVLAITSSEPIKAGDIFDKTDGVLVRILRNDENVWPLDREWETVELFREIPRAILQTPVKAGDVIRFRVNMNTVPKGNGTSWNPFVYYIS